MNQKLVFFFFLSVFNICNCFAQQGTNTNLKHYKSQINKAELSICDSKYTKASRLFKKAFKTRRPFMRDVYNAWVLEAQYGKQEKAKAYFDTLINHKVSKRLLYFNVKRMKIFRDKPYWHQLVSQLDTAWDRPVFYKDFSALVRTDQAIRFKCGGYNDEVCNSSIREVDSTNLLAYIKLCQKYDYPNEYKHGCELPGNGLIWDLILLHNAAWGRHWADTIFYRKIELGVLDTRDFNGLQLVKIGALCHIIDNELFIPTYFTAEQKKAINEYRRLFYLEDLDSYFKKMEFGFKNSQFKFYNPDETPYIDYGEDKTAKADMLAKSKGKFRIVQKIN